MRNILQNQNQKNLDGRNPFSLLFDASGTNRPSKAGSANRAGSGHGGSGESPDVRDLAVSNPNAPEDDDRPDAQVGFFVFSPGASTNNEPIRIMSTTTAAPSIRIDPENPNHHLWNNHGTWFLHYTVHPTPFTKERIRRTLGPKDVGLARRNRDAIFAAHDTTSAAA